jgi:hypothetical protein
VGKAITADLPVISMVVGLSSAKAEPAWQKRKKANKEMKHNLLIIAELHDEGLISAADQQDVWIPSARKPHPSMEGERLARGMGEIDDFVS